MQNALSSSSPRRRTGEGWGRAGGGPIWAPRAKAVAGRRGKRARRGVGFDSPAHLGSGRGEGAGRREPAAAGGNGGGGGAVRCEERRWWPGKFGCGGAAPAGPFIAVVGRFGGGRGRWRVGGARRAARRALMALGRARASWSGARAARLCRDDGTCAAAVSTGRRCAGQWRAARGAARRARGLGGAHVAAA